MTTWRHAAGWFLLAVVGQAASLRLIDAGPLVHYQHYRPLAVLVVTHPWLLAIVAAQTVAVVIALVQRVRAHTTETRSHPISMPRLVTVLVLATCTAATVSPSVSRFLSELIFAACLQLLSIATIALMALAVPQESIGALARRLDALVGIDNRNEKLGGAGGMSGGPVRLDRFAWTAAAIATILAALLSVFSYERHPHVPDEVAYLLHARYFAAGLWTMPAPPVAAAFDVDLMNFEPTRWFSPVPPGWPAVLALGVLGGVPWLVNPILGGVNVLLASLFLGHLYSRRVARYATALLAISPWCLFLAMSWMTDTFTLTCALAAALGVVRARRTGAFGAGLLAGAGVGATSVLRPLSGAIVGLLVAAWSLGVGGRRLRVGSLAGLALGTAAIGALTLPYNEMLTGHALTFPISAYTDKYHGVNSNAYGFGADRGMGWPTDPNPGHGPIDGIVNADLNAFGINTDLFGWSTGSLIFVAILLCSGVLNRSDWLMIATIAAVFVGHFFYYFSGGSDFGAQYWFPMVVPLVALTARGMQVLEMYGAGPRVGVAVTALIAMTLVNYVPWRATDKYHNYRGMRADIRTLGVEHGFAHDLVLIRGERFPDYASAAVQNPIDLTDPGTIYAWDRSAEVRQAVIRAFPDRRVWIVDGPTLTGSGYRVAEGPLPAATLLPAGAAK